MELTRVGCFGHQSPPGGVNGLHGRPPGPPLLYVPRAHSVYGRGGPRGVHFSAMAGRPPGSPLPSPGGRPGPYVNASRGGPAGRLLGSASVITQGILL
jgi:hypothetical protein